MKIIKKANGQQTIKMSKEEWKELGKIAGWVDDIDPLEEYDPLEPEIYDDDPLLDEEEAEMGLDPTLKKLIEDFEVEVEEDTKAKPDDPEFKNKEREQKKKDPATWAAEEEERRIKEEREKAKRQREKEFKKLERDVYSKPPLD